MSDEHRGVIPRSDAVVPLKANHAPGEASPSVVKLLEDILEEAKRGEIVALAIATVSPAGYCGRANATSGTPHMHHLVAACSYLLRWMQDCVIDAP